MQSPMVKLLRVRGTRICSSHHEWKQQQHHSLLTRP
jgi:hypothetical protein